MRKILGFAVVAALLAAGTARAQGPSGFSLGLRLGYGIPMGDFDGGDPTAVPPIPSTALGDVLSGQVPLQIDAMYRFDPNWSLGLYFQYGFASVSNNFCGTGFSCSASDTRFGAQVHYRFASQGFVPWVGLGLGGEWTTITVESGGVSADVKANGFEFVNLQVGGDWFLSPAFRLGPYAQLSLAQFSTLEFLGVSGTLNKTTHEWLQIGLKGTFDL